MDAESKSRVEYWFNLEGRYTGGREYMLAVSGADGLREECWGVEEFVYRFRYALNRLSAGSDEGFLARLLVVIGVVDVVEARL
jgi:hypothetical protein